MRQLAGVLNRPEQVSTALHRSVQRSTYLIEEIHQQPSRAINSTFTPKLTRLQENELNGIEAPFDNSLSPQDSAEALSAAEADAIGHGNSNDTPSENELNKIEAQQVFPDWISKYNHPFPQNERAKQKQRLPCCCP